MGRSQRSESVLPGERVFLRLLLDFRSSGEGGVFDAGGDGCDEVRRGAMLVAMGRGGRLAAARLGRRRAVVDYFHRSTARQVGHARVGACQLDRCRRRERRGRRRQTNEAV